MLSRRIIRLIPKRNFFTIINAHEGAIRLKFGKYTGEIKPGIRLCIPLVHKIYQCDMRDTVGHIPEQSLISSDNVTFHVTASVQYRIVTPETAYYGTTDIEANILDICKMVLKNSLSSHEINDILSHRDKIAKEIQQGMTDIEEDWGIKIKTIQVDDIYFDDSMRRAMAVKAEAVRNAEAKIINARADVATAIEYKKAAEIYDESAASLKLRELDTWKSISKNPASTIYVVPSSISDLLKK